MARWAEGREKREGREDSVICGRSFAGKERSLSDGRDRRIGQNATDGRRGAICESVQCSCRSQGHLCVRDGREICGKRKQSGRMEAGKGTK